MEKDILQHSTHPKEALVKEYLQQKTDYLTAGARPTNPQQQQQQSQQLFQCDANTSTQCDSKLEYPNPIIQPSTTLQQFQPCDLISSHFTNKPDSLTQTSQLSNPQYLSEGTVSRSYNVKTESVPSDERLINQSQFQLNRPIPNPLGSKTDYGASHMLTTSQPFQLETNEFLSKLDGSLHLGRIINPNMLQSTSKIECTTVSALRANNAKTFQMDSIFTKHFAYKLDGGMSVNSVFHNEGAVLKQLGYKSNDTLAPSLKLANRQLRNSETQPGSQTPPVEMDTAVQPALVTQTVIQSQPVATALVPPQSVPIGNDLQLSMQDEEVKCYETLKRSDVPMNPQPGEPRETIAENLNGSEEVMVGQDVAVIANNEMGIDDLVDKSDDDDDDDPESDCPKSKETDSDVVANEGGETSADGKADKYPCKVCDKTFSKPNYLKVHTRKHMAIRSFSCRYCPKKFTFMTHLKVHAKMHSVQKNFKCSTCNKLYSRRCDLIRHSSTHLNREKVFTCDICSSSFPTEAELGEHATAAHGKAEKLFACDSCDKTFVQKRDLKRHAIVHFLEKPFDCDVCGKSFPQSYALKRHKTIHLGEKPHSCTICKKSFSKNTNIKAHMRKHTGDRPFSCKVCTKKFAHNSHLKTHVRTHTGEKPYSCKICNKRFSHSGHLKAHQTVHTRDRPFTCETCGRKFAQKDILKTHTRIHTGQLPFRCTVCNKAFPRSSDLKSHVVSHSNAKPYSCNVCSKAFSRNSDFKRHLTIHAEIKPFACNICHKTFTQSWTLKCHLGIHTGIRPFPCSVCHKTFSRQSDVKSHMRKHTGEKPFGCDLCSKAFSRNDHLKNHRRTHTGEKPFVCNICPQMFLQRSVLKRHLLTHSGEKPFDCKVCGKNFSRNDKLKIHMESHVLN